MDYFIFIFLCSFKNSQFHHIQYDEKIKGAFIREGVFIRVNIVSATMQAQGHMHPVLKNKALKALGFCLASSILNSFAHGRTPNLNDLLV